jgi:quinone-modifying oxidoreductase subunit QmoA
MSASTSQPLLVVGAGIAGVTAALEAAEAGREVVLIEQEPAVGGRVFQHFHYFPKNCPPSCGMEINIRRLDKNPRIRLLTSTTIEKADKTGDSWTVTLASAPKYINERCTACGDCTKACKSTVADPFNYGMSQVPAVRLYHENAWPHRFILDRSACSDEELKAIQAACTYDAVDLDAQATTETIEVGAIVVATGFHPYPLDNLKELGGGVLDDVIANVQMERLASPTGPTEGKILKVSDGQPPKKVAFVQCAGSRDVNHLPYCSAICCLASLKQAVYVREQLPESEVTMYYIDRRTPGRNEDVLEEVSNMEGVKLVKGKVGKISKGPQGNLLLRVEDVEAGKLTEDQADLVVLATGMEPNTKLNQLACNIEVDQDGFALDNIDNKLVVAGVSRRPEDVAASVRDATGSAAKACVAAGRSS